LLAPGRGPAAATRFCLQSESVIAKANKDLLTRLERMPVHSVIAIPNIGNPTNESSYVQGKSLTRRHLDVTMRSGFIPLNNC
jgi:hypothetical protein